MAYRTAVCRLCLVTDDRMYAVGGTPLQIVYEKLTNIQFLDPAKPVVACHICLAYLKKSWKLMVTSLKADNVFIDFLKNNAPVDLKSLTLIDRRAYGLANPLVTTVVELTDRAPEDVKVEDLEVKKESEPTFFNAGLVEEPLVTIESNQVTVQPVQPFEIELLKEETEEWLDEATRPDSDSEDDLPIKRPAKRQASKRSTAKRAPAKRAPAKRSPAKRSPAKRAPAKRAPAKRQPKAVPIVTFVEPPKEDEKEEPKEDDKEENKEEPKEDIREEDEDDDSDYEPPADGVKEDREEDGEPVKKKRNSNKKIQDIAATTTDLNRVLSLQRIPVDGTFQFQCRFCQVTFSFKPAMRAHLKEHRPYECKICHKTFKTAWHRVNHMKTHTGEKPYMCNVCGLRCSEKSYLIIHLRTHTGEKPYQCPVCMKAFSKSTYMKVHLRIHTGEKDFECPVCFRRFNQKVNLHTHLKKHRR